MSLERCRSAWLLATCLASTACAATREARLDEPVEAWEERVVFSPDLVLRQPRDAQVAGNATLVCGFALRSRDTGPGSDRFDPAAVQPEGAKMELAWRQTDASITGGFSTFEVSIDELDSGCWVHDSTMKDKGWRTLPTTDLHPFTPDKLPALREAIYKLYVHGNHDVNAWEGQPIVVDGVAGYRFIYEHTFAREPRFEEMVFVPLPEARIAVFHAAYEAKPTGKRLPRWQATFDRIIDSVRFVGVERQR